MLTSLIVKYWSYTIRINTCHYQLNIFSDFQSWYTASPFDEWVTTFPNRIRKQRCNLLCFCSRQIGEIQTEPMAKGLVGLHDCISSPWSPALRILSDSPYVYACGTLGAFELKGEHMFRSDKNKYSSSSQFFSSGTHSFQSLLKEINTCTAFPRSTKSID